jgi:hypothetical protein
MVFLIFASVEMIPRAGVNQVLGICKCNGAKDGQWSGVKKQAPSPDSASSSAQEASLAFSEIKRYL